MFPSSNGHGCIVDSEMVVMVVGSDGSGSDGRRSDAEAEDSVVS